MYGNYNNSNNTNENSAANWQTLLNSLNEVPAMPNIIVRALNIVKDPEAGAKQLAKIVSCDQSLSTKVLTVVNSSYYGFPQQITSISRAISLIGMSKTKNIIMTVAMKPMLTNQGGRELWKHSIMTAVGCEYIANYLKIMNTDEAFVTGFLHDLGKLVLNIKDANLYEKVKLLAEGNGNIIQLEQQYFGTDHCQMGSLLTKRWQLPLLINNVVKYHHAPADSSMPIPCTLVYLVDSLVKEESDFDNLDKDVLKNLKLNLEQPQILRESIIERANMLLSELSN